MPQLAIHWSTVVSLSLLVAQNTFADEPSRQPPNVLMIAIDDLNDWIEPLGGHPQSKTPGIKALAQRGVLFRNAHCQSPLCNSSRTSLMLSLRPSTTGVYGLAPWVRELDQFRTSVSLPQFFESIGYQTYSCGKIYHGGNGKKVPPGAHREFMHWGPGSGPGLRPDKKIVPPTPHGNNPWVDWGLFGTDQDRGDWKVAGWAETKLKEMPQDKPFFLAVGFFFPHVPCYVSQKWLDMYPDDNLVLPEIPADDLDDCSPFSEYLHWKLPEPKMDWLRKHNEHRNLVRCYLAATSFMDSQVQRVINALDDSTFADNTIVVLWSDHGWHLGEKNMTGKTTLWERSTRVPLIFAGPGIEPGICDQPTELLDIYPTLAALVKQTPPDHVEGTSLVPQLNDPKSVRTRPAITTHNPGNFSVRTRRYRLIHYADASEELYNTAADPLEHHNLIANKEHRDVAERLRKWLPSKFAGLAKGSKHRVLEKRDGSWQWEGEPIEDTRQPQNLAK